MNNIDSIFLYIFIFSSLTILKTLIKLANAVSQKIPQPVFKSDTALLYQGLALSYVITYLIQNIQ